MKRTMLLLMVGLLTGCATTKSISVNGVASRYRITENSSDGPTVIISRSLLYQNFGLGKEYDSCELVLRKILSPNGNAYVLELEARKSNGIRFKEFTVTVDGVRHVFVDPRPRGGLSPGVSFYELHSVEVSEEFVRALAEATQSVKLRYPKHNPYPVLGDKLTRVNAYASGLLSIESPADLSLANQ